jgi:hypothetical protein
MLLRRSLAVSGRGSGCNALRVAGAALRLRPPRYSTLTPLDVTHFERIVGAHNVVSDPESLQRLSTDWTKKWTGRSPLGLFPTSTQQVSQILAHCNTRNLAVVPQAGNTGLVGGGIPISDEGGTSLLRPSQHTLTNSFVHRDTSRPLDVQA